MVAMAVLKVAVAVCLGILGANAAPATTDHVGIVWFGRHDVPVSAYTPLLDRLVAAAANATVIPAGSDPAKAVTSLREEYGATKVVVVSHSMEQEAGVVAQSFVSSRGAELGIGALVLLSGFLQRTNRPGLVACAQLAKKEPKFSLKQPLGYLEDGAHDCSKMPAGVVFPVPTLSVGGELDGVVRVGRVAEAAYTQRDTKQHVVVVVEGMTHSALLSNFTVSGDLPTAITDTSNTKAFATVVNAFGAFVREENLATFEAQTERLLAPLVTAFVQQEGSWWFNDNFDEEHGTSRWAALAQQRMVSPLPEGWAFADNGVASTNEFHLLSDEDKIPPYFRHKHRANVVALDGKLESSTIAQLRYTEVPLSKTDFGLNSRRTISEEKCNLLANGGFLSAKDVGKDFVSALEIGTKMRSRQLVYNMTVGPAHAPSSLDDGNRCAAINEHAYEWALAQASPEARQRHNKFGVKMRMLADVFEFGGPWWIYTYVSYKMNSTSDVLDIVSQKSVSTLKALKYGVGVHYCNLLSPARAIEWIYTDSLRT